MLCLVWGLPGLLKAKGFVVSCLVFVYTSNSPLDSELL